MAYNNLIEQFQLTQEQLAEKVGKKRTTIANYLRLLKLPADVQIALRNKQIDQGHARALLGIQSPSTQLKLFKEIQKNDYSVRKVEEMVQAINNGNDIKSGKHMVKTDKPLPEEYVAIKQRLSDFFQSKVQMTYSQNGKGKISIPFQSQDDLERLMLLFDNLKK